MNLEEWKENKKHGWSVWVGGSEVNDYYLNYDKASELYQEGGWRYVSKSVWKEKVRDVEKTSNNTPKTKKNNKMSKSAKRHLRKKNK